MKHNKVEAFADDLLLAIRSRDTSAAENISNIEETKITAWAKNKKIKFNEENSKFMIVSRRKRKEFKDINIYRKHKPIQQVTKMKYVGLIIDNKFKFSEHTKATQPKEAAN
jgi:hypothetical protein